MEALLPAMRGGRTAGPGMIALLEVLAGGLIDVIRGTRCTVCRERHRNMAAHHYVDHAHAPGQQP